MITKGEALISLRPGAAWKLNGDEVIWLDENQTQPTESEITEKLSELEASHPLAEVRAERNAKLAETDWVVTMHKELGTNIPSAMKTYRAALRDITDSATSLDDVTWPEKP